MDQIVEEINVESKEEETIEQKEERDQRRINDLERERIRQRNKPAPPELTRERIAMEAIYNLDEQPMLWTRKRRHEEDEPPKPDLRYHYNIVDGKKVSYNEKKLLMADKAERERKEKAENELISK